MTEQGCCPTCGAELRDQAFAWDIETRTFITGVLAVRFPRRQALIFDALWRARRRGGYQTREQFIDAAYADEVDGGPISDNTLSVHLTRMREKLKGSGYTIGSNMGNPRGGYRIVKEAA